MSARSGQRGINADEHGIDEGSVDGESRGVTLKNNPPNVERESAYQIAGLIVRITPLRRPKPRGWRKGISDKSRTETVAGLVPPIGITVDYVRDGQNFPLQPTKPPAILCVPTPNQILSSSQMPNQTTSNVPLHWPRHFPPSFPLRHPSRR